MKTVRLMHSTVLASLAGIAMMATSAHAQEAAAGESEGDVIVTATKRNESLMQTALPISAVTGEQLTRMNANSLSDYVTRLPGVVFNDYQPGVSEVVIRGIAATTYHEQGQTTVGYYINEIPVVEPGFPIGIPDVDTFDLERVEVLRGPQGTLFGSSTLGGLVNYVAATADPSKFEAAATTLLGSTKNASGDLNHGFKGMLNVPVIPDVLAVRVVAGQRFDAGYLDNPAINKKGSNDFQSNSYRGSIVFTPSANTTVTYMSYYQKTKLDDQTYLDLGKPYIRDVAHAEWQKTDFWLNSLRLDQELGFAKFTVIGSVNKKTNTTIFSNQGSPYVTGVATGPDSAYSYNVADANIKTIEARLASTGEGPFRWLVGVSYMRATKDTNDVILQNGAEAYINANPGQFTGPASILAPGNRIYGYLTDSFNKDFGIFGEVSVKPIEQIEITLGGRYYDTTARAGLVNQASFLSGSLVDATSSLNQKEDGFTPKATIAFRPNSDLMVYATYSQGFRVGGANPNAGLLPGLPTNYESDKVDNYEIGVKGKLGGDLFTFDLTAFHLDWKNIQARLFGPAPTYYSYVINAGGADVEGIEFSGTIRPIPQFSLNTNITYQDAKLTEFLPYPFDAAGLGGYPVGTRLPGSSKWSIANTATIDLRDVGGEPMFEVAHRYLSSAPTSFDDVSRRGDFHVFDARASIDILEGVRATAFMNNVFDKYGVLSAPFANDAFTPQGSIIRPRSYGLRVDWKM